MVAAKGAARARAAAAGDLDALARMRARQPATKTVWLAVDDDAVEAFRAVERETFGARIGSDEVAKRAAENRVAEARAELEATGAVLFRLISQGRRAYEALIRSPECQPRDEDHDRVQKALGQAGAKAAYNTEVFPFALVELACDEPAGLTADELREWVDDGRLSQGEMQQLAAAAEEVHTGSRVLDLGK